MLRSRTSLVWPSSTSGPVAFGGDPDWNQFPDPLDSRWSRWDENPGWDFPLFQLPDGTQTIGDDGQVLRFYSPYDQTLGLLWRCHELGRSKAFRGMWVFYGGGSSGAWLTRRGGTPSRLGHPGAYPDGLSIASVETMPDDNGTLAAGNTSPSFMTSFIQAVTYRPRHLLAGNDNPLITATPRGEVLPTGSVPLEGCRVRDLRRSSVPNGGCSRPSTSTKKADPR